MAREHWSDYVSCIQHLNVWSSTLIHSLMQHSGDSFHHFLDWQPQNFMACWQCTLSCFKCHMRCQESSLSSTDQFVGHGMSHDNRLTCNSWPSHSPPSLSPLVHPPLVSSQSHSPCPWLSCHLSSPLLNLFFSFLPFFSISLCSFLFPLFLSSPLLSPHAMSVLSWPCLRPDSWPYGGISDATCQPPPFCLSLGELSYHLPKILTPSSAPCFSSISQHHSPSGSSASVQ